MYPRRPRAERRDHKGRPHERRDHLLTHGSRPAGTLLAVSAALGTLGVAGPPPAAGAPGAAPFAAESVPATGFGGYRWQGQVRSISAQWQVPTIDATSPPGFASTWIGAQNRRGGPPFIQLGVIETSLGGAAASYQAFWSDPVVGFHPQPLGALHGGDLVTATMTRIPTGWHVVLDDVTSATVMATSVAYGAHGSYTQAEWLQEDPTSSSVTAIDLPYPHTSPVAFEQLSVNGSVPTLSLADGQTLSATGDVFLVPTPFSSDSFQLLPARGPALRYLIDAMRVDRAISAWSAQLVTWELAPVAQRVARVDRLAAAYRFFDRALERTPWPVAARPALIALARADARYAAALVRWARSGAALSSAAYRVLSQIDDAKVTDAARAGLGLPPA